MIHSHIQSLAQVDGVVAAAVVLDGAVYSAGDDAWRSTLVAMIEVFGGEAIDDNGRLVLSEHTVHVVQHGPERAAVVVTQGHAVAKSIHRTVKRMAERDGAKFYKAADVRVSFVTDGGAVTKIEGLAADSVAAIVSRDKDD